MVLPLGAGVKPAPTKADAPTSRKSLTVKAETPL